MIMTSAHRQREANLGQFEAPTNLFGSSTPHAAVSHDELTLLVSTKEDPGNRIIT